MAQPSPEIAWPAWPPSPAWYLLWALSEALGLADETFFPGPVKTGKEFWTVLTTDNFDRTFLHQHVLASLQRIIIGFGLGVLFGVPVGLAMGLSNILRGIFDPLIELFRPVPPLAFIPLLILWFGIGETSKVVMLFFAAFFIMVIAARAGVTGVRISKVHAAYSLGASKFTDPAPRDPAKRSCPKYSSACESHLACAGEPWSPLSWLGPIRALEP